MAKSDKLESPVPEAVSKAHYPVVEFPEENLRRPFTAVPGSISLDQIKEAHQREYKYKANPGKYAMLPNGNLAEINRGFTFKYPGEQFADMLASPEKMLLDPKPPFEGGPRYIWKKRHEEQTAMLLRSGRIRYIKESEVDPRSEIAVYTPLPTAHPEISYISRGDLGLYEIRDPKLAYQMYGGWEDLANSKISDLPLELANAPFAREGQTKTHIKVTDVRVDG